MYNSQRIDFNKVRSTQEIFADYLVFMKSEGQSYGLILSIFVLPFALASAYILTQQTFDLQTIDVLSGSYNNMYIALALSFVAKFFGVFVSCAYVQLYMSGSRIDLDSIKSYIMDNFVQAFLASLFVSCALFVGFCCFIVPGVILLPALSMVVYDVLFARQRSFFSLSRCLNLCRTNWRQSFAVVLLCYAVIFVLSIVIGDLLPAENTFLNVVVSSVMTVLSETTMIPFILLYYSLANQNMKL
ncbi:MAG: hypothetical protein IKP08_01000 [Bacteroidales bacterium]|nr:hypothetical protein [Bacteroidales bacterium]